MYLCKGILWLNILGKKVTRLDNFQHSFQLLSTVIFFFGPHHSACRILALRPVIKPGPLAVKAWSPNHWTARESPLSEF